MSTKVMRFMSTY